MVYKRFSRTMDVLSAILRRALCGYHDVSDISLPPTDRSLTTTHCSSVRRLETLEYYMSSNTLKLESVRQLGITYDHAIDDDLSIEDDDGIIWI
jgi:hypothetical protein